MGQQVADRDRPLEPRQRDAVTIDPGEDARIDELRYISRKGVIESKLAGFNEHERADTDDRFGHRGKAKDRVRLHRPARLDVAKTDAGQLRHVVISRDEHHRPGDLTALDAAGNVCARALECRRRQSNLLSRLHGPSLTAVETGAARRTARRPFGVPSVGSRRWIRSATSREVPHPCVNASS